MCPFESGLGHQFWTIFPPCIVGADDFCRCGPHRGGDYGQRNRGCRLAAGWFHRRDAGRSCRQECRSPATGAGSRFGSDAWTGCRQALCAALAEKCFRNWPKDGALLEPKLLAQKQQSGLTLQVLEFNSEENLRFPVYVVRGTKQVAPKILVLNPVDTEGWKKWLAEMATTFADQLPGSNAVTADPAELTAVEEVVKPKPRP